MRSRLESYLFTYATTKIVQEIIKQTSIQVQIFITMNFNMNHNNNNVHLSVIMIIEGSRFACLKPSTWFEALASSGFKPVSGFK